MEKPLRLLLVTDKDGDAAFLRAALAAGCIGRETRRRQEALYTSPDRAVERLH